MKAVELAASPKGCWRNIAIVHLDHPAEQILRPPHRDPGYLTVVKMHGSAGASGDVDRPLHGLESTTQNGCGIAAGPAIFS